MIPYNSLQYVVLTIIIPNNSFGGTEVKKVRTKKAYVFAAVLGVFLCRKLLVMQTYVTIVIFTVKRQLSSYRTYATMSINWCLCTSIFHSTNSSVHLLLDVAVLFPCAIKQGKPLNSAISVLIKQQTH